MLIGLQCEEAVIREIPACLLILKGEKGRPVEHQRNDTM